MPRPANVEGRAGVDIYPTEPRPATVDVIFGLLLDVVTVIPSMVDWNEADEI
jgi:hypothetical protein